jgi:hypothetical protein
MRRGVVFMSCHNAIWEHAAALVKLDINPDKLSHGALAAELTNHLVDGAVLIPGAAGTLPELQQVGFHYAIYDAFEKGCCEKPIAASRP